MKTVLLLLFSALSLSSHALTPAELADSFHARGLAAEKRGDLLTAEKCFDLAIRAQPGHFGAMAEKARLAEKWAAQPELRMQSAMLKSVRFQNATLAEALEYLHQHTGIEVLDGDAENVALQNLVTEIQAWHKLPEADKKAAWAALVKRTRHGRYLQALADTVIATRQAHFSLDMQEVSAEDLLKKIAELAGVTIHRRGGKILYSVRKALPVPPSAHTPPKASAATQTRLIQLETDFKKAGAEALEAAHAKSLADLRANYLSAVKKSQAEARRSGQPSVADALQEEESKMSIGTEIPAEDDPQASEALKKLRGIYRTEAAKAAQARTTGLKPLLDRYDAELAALEAALAGQPDDLAAVKAVREQIAARR